MPLIVNMNNEMIFIIIQINTSQGYCSVISSGSSGNMKCEFCQNGTVLTYDEKCETKGNCKNKLITDIVLNVKMNHPNINGECITTQIEHCVDQNSFGCQRCSDGYYLDSNLQCQICSNECVTCIKSSDYCLSCENGKYLFNNECLENKEMSGTCEVLLFDGSGCAIRKSGYYREGKGCETCLTSCQNVIEIQHV